MKISRYFLSLLLALLAGAAPAQSAAQPLQQTLEGQECLVFFLGGMPGLTRGQTLRYTWAYLLRHPDTRESVFEPLRIRVRLYAADGSVLAQEEAAAVGAGRFQSFDFDRDRINLPGEAGTGRLQVRLEAVVYGRTTNPDIMPERAILETLDATAEVIETLTGRTTVSFKPKEIVVVSSKPPSQ